MAIAILVAPAHGYPDDARTKASIYAYFRIAQDDQPDSNIRMRQFNQHLRQLDKDDIHPVSLDKLVKALRDKRDLTRDSIAITFEGAHRSVARKALPVLRENNIPFTVFIAPGRIDQGMPQYMDWQALRDLKASKLATIGVTLNRYRHSVPMSTKARKQALNRAIARYREEFGHRPRYFAYPYGEYDSQMRKLVKDYGFRAAFGQQSGVAHSQSDFYALPRFTMTEGYGDVRRFRQTARALPLPISDVTPASPIVANNPPQIGFSIPDKLNIEGEALKCYASNGAAVKREIINNRRVELRLDKPFIKRRGRVNCIAPAQQGDTPDKQRWRWYGMMFVVPETLRTGGGEKD